MDVGFNKEVAEEGAIYFNKEEGNLAQAIDVCDKMKKTEIDELALRAKERINKYYTWDRIIKKYESLFLKGE